MILDSLNHKVTSSYAVDHCFVPNKLSDEIAQQRQERHHHLDHHMLGALDIISISPIRVVVFIIIVTVCMIKVDIGDDWLHCLRAR